MLPPAFKVRTEHHFGALTKTVAVFCLLFCLRGRIGLSFVPEQGPQRGCLEIQGHRSSLPGHGLGSGWMRSPEKIQRHADSILIARKSMLRAEQRATEKLKQSNVERHRYEKLQKEKTFLNARAAQSITGRDQPKK